MPRIGVIGIIAFGALIYFITNSRDDVEESNKPKRTIIQKPYKTTNRKKRKKKKSSK